MGMTESFRNRLSGVNTSFAINKPKFIATGLIEKSGLQIFEAGCCQRYSDYYGVELRVVWASKLQPGLYRVRNLSYKPVVKKKSFAII